MQKGIESWNNLLTYAWNAFSTPLLLKTLFSPIGMDNTPSKEFSFFEKIVFHIFMRLLGFIVRSALIVLGFAFTFIVVLAYPLFLILPINIEKKDLEKLGSIGAELSYGSTYSLNAHSRDVISYSSSELYGKEKSLRMIERALSKNKNHNVLLVGDTGVGKSSLISYLGRMAQSGLAFPSISHHRVVELYTENLTVEDFDKTLADAAEAGNIILVIKNIHSYESMYDRLSPYLDKSHLAIIATTDLPNYDGVLKKHPEFLSKFEKVDVVPTNFDETLKILKNQALHYEMKITEEALEEIVRLSDRFIGNQPQPLKSLLVLEELQSLGREIAIEDVRQIISDKTNMPIGVIGADEKKVLIELEQRMRQKIVGQDEAVKDVSEALRRLRTGIADPTKPAGSFLFLGSTGVGKTYTAKILAESYFGRKNAMIRFDMSEFSLPESVPVFTERLARVIEEAPLSLVFFDELEKANRLIHNLMLQILDEGRLTRESGREVSFKDAIIIATSNAGSADIIANPNVEKKVLLDSLIKKTIFAPEFLNRFSSVILFKPLDQAQARQVAEHLLLEFKDRIMEDKGINLMVTNELIDKIASAGFDPDFGARPIKRAMEELVENKVADYIIQGNTGGTLTI